MRICTACGNRNADEALFCSACGATLAEARPLQPIQAAQPTMKPVPLVKTITPLAQAPLQYAPPMVMPRMPLAVGSCFYHHELPASYICLRCGKSICHSCARAYGELAICPQCYWVIGPRGGMSAQAPPAQ